MGTSSNAGSAAKATTGPGRSMGVRFAAGAAVVALVAAGCGSSKAAETGSSPSPASTSGGSFGSLSAIETKVATLEKPVSSVKVDVPPIKNLPDLKGKTLLIVPALGIVFSSSIGVITGALKPFGVKVRECDGQGNPSTMASCMQQAATIPDLAGVMTIGVPVEQAPNAYAALAKKDIPVAAVQQDPGGVPSVIGKLGFVGSTSVLKGGVTAAADYVIAKSGGKGDIVAIGDNESVDVTQASEYMQNYIKSNCPACKVTLKDIASTEMSDATPFISAQVLKDPSTDWVISLNQDVSGEAVYKGLQSANATTKVKQGGPGVGLLSMQQVAQGSAGYVAAIAGDLNAWNWTDAMLRVIAKEPVPTNYPEVVRLFDTSTIKQIKVTPAGTASFVWFGTADFPQQYNKLWGIK